MDKHLLCNLCGSRMSRARGFAHRHGEVYTSTGYSPVRFTVYQCKPCGDILSIVFVRKNDAWVSTRRRITLYEYYQKRKTVNVPGRIGSTASEWSKRMARGHG